MKVAVFLKNNELTVLHEDKVHVLIFNMLHGNVVGVENTSLEKPTQDAILNWLNHKSINQIYLSEIDDDIYDKIKSTGVQIRTVEMLKDDKLYNSLALPSLLIKKTS